LFTAYQRDEDVGCGGKKKSGEKKLTPTDRSVKMETKRNECKWWGVGEPKTQTSEERSRGRKKRL